MKKFVLLVPIVMMIIGVWTFLFGCGDTLPHNIADASDNDLCMTLRVCIDERKIPEWNNPAEEDLSALTEEERAFYILSVFDDLFQCGGIAGYIGNTDGVYLDEIEPLLRDFHLHEMADVYHSYFAAHNIIIEDFLNDTIEPDALAEKYDTEAFDNAFASCYEETDLTKVLADYARGTFVEDYQKWIYERN